MSSDCFGGVPIFAHSLLQVCSKFGLNLAPSDGQVAVFAPRFASRTKYCLVRVPTNIWSESKLLAKFEQT